METRNEVIKKTDNRWDEKKGKEIIRRMEWKGETRDIRRDEKVLILSLLISVLQK